MFKEDVSDFITETENNLKDHKLLAHAIEKDTVEIKLELFTLVNFENNVLEARQVVMEKLNEQSEVEKVKTVYVNKSDTYMDIDNLRWNTIEIVLITNKTEILWKDRKFRHNIFSKCYLWETVKTDLGEHNREFFNKQKEDICKSGLMARGYFL